MIEGAAAVVLDLGPPARGGGEQAMLFGLLVLLVDLDRRERERDTVRRDTSFALTADTVDPAGVGGPVDHPG